MKKLNFVLAVLLGLSLVGARVWAEDGMAGSTPAMKSVKSDSKEITPKPAKKSAKAKGGKKDLKGKKNQITEKVGYTCPMCHIDSEKPGKCPMCGMDMVKKTKEMEKSSGDAKKM